MAGGVTAAVLHCTQITASVPAEHQIVNICMLEYLLDRAVSGSYCNCRRLEFTCVL